MKAIYSWPLLLQALRNMKRLIQLLTNILKQISKLQNCCCHNSKELNILSKDILIARCKLTEYSVEIRGLRKMSHHLPNLAAIIRLQNRLIADLIKGSNALNIQTIWDLCETFIEFVNWATPKSSKKCQNKTASVSSDQSDPALNSSILQIYYFW